MKILINYGRLVTASDTFQADFLIDGEKIAQIVDAMDRFILPGGIDVYIHLELPMMGATCHAE